MREAVSPQRKKEKTTMSLTQTQTQKFFKLMAEGRSESEAYSLASQKKARANKNTVKSEVVLVAVKETEKAFGCYIGEGEYKGYNADWVETLTWFPKSQCQVVEAGKYQVPAWLYNSKKVS